MSSIVVVGAGAVGGYYGALLARAGHDVQFVLRRDFEAVRERGLEVKSSLGGFLLRNARAVRSAEEAGPSDWVICALKTTALGRAPDLIAPSVGAGTRILALMNGLGVEEVLVQRFGSKRVFGGMAFVCLNRGQPGVVHHLGYGRVTLGHFEDDAREVRAAADLLESGGIEHQQAPVLLAARWEKLGWNIPFSGLSVAAGAVGTSGILADGGLRSLAETLMREVARAANGDLARHGIGTRLDEDDLVKRMVGQTEAMDDYQPSMVIDYLLGRPLEVESILGEPLRRARLAGVPVPTMAMLHALVDHADRQRRGGAHQLTVADLLHAG